MHFYPHNKIEFSLESRFRCTSPILRKIGGKPREYLLSEKFANFFEKFKQEKLAEGDATWAGATVPRKGSVADEDILTDEEREEFMRRAMGLLRIFFDSGMCET